MQQELELNQQSNTTEAAPLSRKELRAQRKQEREKEKETQKRNHKLQAILQAIETLSYPAPFTPAEVAAHIIEAKRAASRWPIGCTSETWAIHCFSGDDDPWRVYAEDDERIDWVAQSQNALSNLNTLVKGFTQ